MQFVLSDEKLDLLQEHVKILCLVNLRKASYYNIMRANLLSHVHITVRQWKKFSTWVHTCTSLIIKGPISSKFLFSHLILYFMQWTSAKFFFDLDSKTIFLWMFKNLKILFLCGRPVLLITASTCSELWRIFRNVWIQTWLISLVLPL